MIEGTRQDVHWRGWSPIVCLLISNSAVGANKFRLDIKSYQHTQLELKSRNSKAWFQEHYRAYLTRQDGSQKEATGTSRVLDGRKMPTTFKTDRFQDCAIEKTPVHLEF